MPETQLQNVSEVCETIVGSSTVQYCYRTLDTYEGLAIEFGLVLATAVFIIWIREKFF